MEESGTVAVLMADAVDCASYLAPQLALVEMADGQHGLLGFRHLDQGSVFLVEQDLHPLKVGQD